MIPMFPTAHFFADHGTATLPGAVYTRVQEADLISAQSPFASPSLSVTQSRLLSLLDSSGRDEFGELSPTQSAFRKTFELVSYAEAILGISRPRGSCTVDSEGGIRTTWSLPDKEVRLICPSNASQEVYLYVETGQGPSISKLPTPSVLAEHLSARNTECQSKTQDS